MMRTRAGNPANVWAIVPVKQLSRAKQRLAPVLSGQQRIALARAMLHDVLTTLSCTPGLAGILVATCDAAAARVAAQFGARLVDNVMETGINAAVRSALRVPEVTSAGVLIVPADIPFATPADMQAALAALDHTPVVLAPALSDGGTNALAMCRRDLIAPTFGTDSFARHQALAQRAGLACGIIRSEGLGRDIDGPDDLVLRAAAQPGSRAAQLLAEFKVARRSAMPAAGGVRK
jgi:2-phospho-L-lactate guanylyltransferase